MAMLVVMVNGWCYGWSWLNKNDPINRYGWSWLIFIDVVKNEANGCEWWYPQCHLRLIMGENWTIDGPPKNIKQKGSKKYLEGKQIKQWMLPSYWSLHKPPTFDADVNHLGHLDPPDSYNQPKLDLATKIAWAYETLWGCWSCEHNHQIHANTGYK